MSTAKLNGHSNVHSKTKWSFEGPQNKEIPVQMLQFNIEKRKVKNNVLYIRIEDKSNSGIFTQNSLDHLRN